MKRVLILFIILYSGRLIAQSPIQSISDVVTDKDTRQPLIGATIVLSDLDYMLGTTTDENGKYKLQNVPVGRRTITCQYIGYSSFVSDGIIINSVSKSVFDIEVIEEFITAEAVVITAYKDVDKPVNELAVVIELSYRFLRLEECLANDEIRI